MATDSPLQECIQQAHASNSESLFNNTVNTALPVQSVTPSQTSKQKKLNFEMNQHLRYCKNAVVQNMAWTDETLLEARGIRCICFTGFARLHCSSL